MTYVAAKNIPSFSKSIKILAIKGLATIPLFTSSSLLGSDDLNLKATVDKLGTIRGHVTHNQKNDSYPICYYLAWNDPTQNRDYALGYSPSNQKFDRNPKSKGIIKITSDTSKWSQPKPWLIKVEKLYSKLSFISNLAPNQINTTKWVIDQFYPQMLEQCPSESEPSTHYKIKAIQKISANITIPDDTILHSPAKTSQNKTQWKLAMIGKRLPFIITWGAKVTKTKVNDIELTVIADKKNRTKLTKYSQIFTKEIYQLFGNSPFNKLIVVETEQLFSARIPGIISLNKPLQATGEIVQEDWLNWSLWQLAYFISIQWIDQTIVIENPDDLWFMRGLADFGAWRAVKADDRVHNLFSSSPTNPPRFHFPFRQGQDLVAFFLTIENPANELVNDQWESIKPIKNQHPLTYIRHSLSLRYSWWLLGNESWTAIHKDFLLENRHKKVTPSLYINYLKNDCKEESKIVLNQLVKTYKKWWQTPNWPDFAISDIIKHPKQNQPNWQTIEVQISQLYNFEIPVDVRIITTDNKTYWGKAQKKTNKWIANIDIQGSIQQVDLNPNREVFDNNRFNNSNTSGSVHFFPGSMNQIADDGYSVLWLPYVAQLPGESLSVMLGFQVLRYAQAGLTGFFSYQPETKKIGYNTFFLTNFPKISMVAKTSIIENFGIATNGERLFLGDFIFSPFYAKELKFEIATAYTDNLEQPSLSHPTVGSYLNFQNKSDHCNYSLTGGGSSMIGANKQDFFYQQRITSMDVNCRIGKLDIEIQTFSASIFGTDTIPDNVKFLPQDVTGARIRIDQPTLPPVDNIMTIGIDVLWPAYLPLPPNFLALPRESRIRMFFDKGQSFDRTSQYADAGIGLYIPFGSDIVGKKSVSILQLSILGVLYKKYNDEDLGEPGILFDFSGKI